MYIKFTPAASFSNQRSSKIKLIIIRSALSMLILLQNKLSSSAEVYDLENASYSLRHAIKPAKAIINSKKRYYTARRKTLKQRRQIGTITYCRSRSAAVIDVAAAVCTLRVI